MFKNTYPTDHISIGVLYIPAYSLSHSNNSGALYQSVTTIGVYCLKGEPYSRAKPKSPTFKMPLWLNSKLDVFKSRCNIQLSCRCATARNNCCIRHFTSPAIEGNTIFPYVCISCYTIRSLVQQQREVIYIYI